MSWILQCSSDFGLCRIFGIILPKYCSRSVVHLTGKLFSMTLKLSSLCTLFRSLLISACDKRCWRTHQWFAADSSVNWVIFSGGTLLAIVSYKFLLLSTHMSHVAPKWSVHQDVDRFYAVCIHQSRFLTYLLCKSNHYIEYEVFETVRYSVTYVTIMLIWRLRFGMRWGDHLPVISVFQSFCHCCRILVLSQCQIRFAACLVPYLINIRFSFANNLAGKVNTSYFQRSYSL